MNEGFYQLKYSTPINNSLLDMSSLNNSPIASRTRSALRRRGRLIPNSDTSTESRTTDYNPWNYSDVFTENPQTQVKTSLNTISKTIDELQLSIDGLLNKNRAQPDRHANVAEVVESTLPSSAVDSLTTNTPATTQIWVGNPQPSDRANRYNRFRSAMHDVTVSDHQQGLIGGDGLSNSIPFSNRATQRGFSGGNGNGVIGDTRLSLNGALPTLQGSKRPNQVQFTDGNMRTTSTDLLHGGSMTTLSDGIDSRANAQSTLPEFSTNVHINPAPHFVQSNTQPSRPIKIASEFSLNHRSSDNRLYNSRSTTDYYNSLFNGGNNLPERSTDQSCADLQHLHSVNNTESLINNHNSRAELFNTHVDNNNIDQNIALCNSSTRITPSSFNSIMKGGIPPPSRQDGRLHKPVIYPEKFDGSFNKWREFISHFETCAILNNWTETEMALWLQGSLKGRAATFLLSFPQKQWTFSELKLALHQRFGPNQQPNVYLAQLHSRKRKANESIWELAEAIRDLVSLAYPETADNVLIERLSLNAFIGSLSSWELKQFILSRQPSDFQSAIHIANEWESYKALNDSEIHKRGTRVFNCDTVTGDNIRPTVNQVSNNQSAEIQPELQKSDIVKIQEQVHRLQKELDKEKAKSKLKCTFCGRRFHTEATCYSKHGFPAHMQSGNQAGSPARGQTGPK